MRMQSKRAQVKRGTCAACWMWLVACATVLACGSPALAQSTSGDDAAAKHAEAMAFLSQLAEQAGETGRLLFGLSLISGGIYGMQPEEIDRAALELKQALRASNVHGSPFAVPLPTGDALFDRLALAADQRMLSTSALDFSAWTEEGGIPDAELAAWESDFAGDPRYWELRYFSATSTRLAPATLSGYSKPAEFLLEIVRQGQATADTYLMLVLDEDADACLAALPLAGLVPAPLPGADGMTPADADAARQRTQEQAQLALLNAAAELDPRQAWAYYLRASFWFDIGEQELGLRELQAGNSAPDISLPVPWPVELIRHAPMADLPPGSAAVCGAIGRASWLSGLLRFDTYFRFTRHARETLVAANLSGNIDGLDAWHHFACRLGASLDVPAIQDATARRMVEEISGYLEESCGSQLAPSQMETLDRMRGAIYTLRETTASNYSAGAMSGDYYGLLVALDVARGLFVVDYLDQCRKAAAKKPAAPIYADLSQIHYPQLNLPDCMQKYPALTADEYAAKLEARRVRLEQERQELLRTLEDSGSLIK